MKKAKLFKSVFSAVVVAAFCLVGCQEDLDVYTIDAPDDLQAKIDSIAAAKAAQDTGDTTFLTINTSIVGNEDYTSGWWTAFSDYFAVPTNKLLHLEFINHNGGSALNWNNVTFAITNEIGDRDGEGYAEYCVLRSDAWGWGNGDFDLGVLSHNYPDTDGDDDIWNDFRTTMDGARVSLDIDHSATGYVYVTFTALGTNGTELVMTYNQPVSATQDLNVFLIADASYFEMKEAYLLPSQVTAIEDVNASSIVVTGAPEFVEIGNENFWGNAIATVTYEDGSSAEADSADISFTVVPDMSTVGEKTVIVAYSKTKQGAFGPAVSTFYILGVVNAVTELEVTTPPDVTTYTFPGPAAPVFNATGMVVTATYSDGSTGVISNGNLQIEIPAADGAQEAVISYVGATSTVTTTVAITNTMGGTNQVGAPDFSTGWWTAFSNEYHVAAGSTRKFKLDLYSSGANNWNSPSLILRKANLTEYAVVRMDNFGWGDGYGSATGTHDWNWDTFAANLNDSYIEITVTNNGDGTANVRYDVTYANNETHFQLYEGVTVDSSDLNCAIVIDGCSIDILSVE